LPVEQVQDTVAALEADGGSSSEDEGGEGGDNLLDWRAKKSAF
jgi:hypothetical protein